MYKKIIKTIIGWLPFASILFAVSFFTALEPEKLIELTIHIPLIISSIFLLYIVFVLRALLWWSFLKNANLSVSLKDALTSRFITILTKYIPGKIWPLVTIAHQLGEQHNFKNRIIFATWFQLLIITAGLFIGLLGLITVLSLPIYVYILIIFFYIILNIIIVLSPDNVNYIYLFKKPTYPHLILNNHTPLLLLGLSLTWIILSAAYWLLFQSVGFDLPAWVVLTQPLANIAGIIFPLAPGGLGVRELASTLYMTAANIDLSDALIFSTLSRIWFFCVEVLIFLTGLLMSDKGIYK